MSLETYDPSNLIPFPGDLTSSGERLQQRKEQFERKSNAFALVEPMLKSYPEYGKTPPEYLAGIVGAFSNYPASVQEKLADPIRGLRGKCAFLPTIADVVKLADEFSEAEFRSAELNRKYSSVVKSPWQRNTVVHNPFPQLSQAFADEPELLQKDFGILQSAYHALFKGGGKDAAREILKRKKEDLK